jgi:hypothetical protein
MMYCHLGQRLLIFPILKAENKKAINKIKRIFGGPPSIAKAIKEYTQLAKKNGDFEHGNDTRHYKIDI